MVMPQVRDFREMMAQKGESSLECIGLSKNVSKAEELL